MAVTIARTAINDGYWLTPHMFNERFVERPTLLIIVDHRGDQPAVWERQSVYRSPPTILVLLGGSLPIYSLLRRVGASNAAQVTK